MAASVEQKDQQKGEGKKKEHEQEQEKEREPESPRLVLRTYRAGDYPYVDHMFISSYFALVPEGVRRKLWTPLTWVVWFAVYSYLLMIAPILLSGLDFPSWSCTVLKLFFTFAWAAVGFAALFVITDQFDTQHRVEYIRQNDLCDPEVSYLHWRKEERILVRQRLPESERTPSHFWVLVMDNEPCGMVGLACNAKDVSDQRPVPLAPWQKIGTRLLKRYHLSVPASFERPSTTTRPLFAKAHAPHTATLTRLTIKYEYQSCSLSTLLVNRAMVWASEHGIKRVYAETNEMMMAAEQILSKRHGFKQTSKHSTGWLGQYEAVWEVEVASWMKSYGDKTKDAFQKVPTQK
ncbi:hypothetical protein BDF14DRAFT_1726032 [Spinellus fusiger]|nr:hypothetical protein BDF14DRAFT_1726032 [Spinellus fusiger]